MVQKYDFHQMCRLSNAFDPFINTRSTGTGNTFRNKLRILIDFDRIARGWLAGRHSSTPVAAERAEQKMCVFFVCCRRLIYIVEHTHTRCLATEWESELFVHYEQLYL